ncbi:hypothetical protein I6F35_10885 [Bradyrhizobium sp. BRP22]|uniref:hypothetical protein n=1 Tax=Bradyrhizobium sp. BRP22 TaxID=2793821 RepID=UPI001CD4E329|nr:hypothetical protein [Bradyrhizobium sp. BRP22]MCA1453716.1 hypothetical protein [Bradyrhizobium sp. BRP22]
MSNIYDSDDCVLWDSLNAIKQAQIQLHLLNGEGANPTVIASRIQLCDVLLGEISGIRTSLAKHLEYTRGAVHAGTVQLHS